MTLKGIGEGMLSKVRGRDAEEERGRDAEGEKG